jgi:alpha-N-arabinofuranosidase
MMKNAMANFDGLSYHYYSTDWGDQGQSTGFNETAYYKFVALGDQIRGRLDELITIMNKYDANGTKGLVVDEWGTWHKSIAGMGALYQQNTVRDAQIASIHLNAFINRCKRVKVACVAQTCNVLQALFLTENGGQNRFVKTPTYYVFKLFKPHHEGKMVPTTLVCPTNEKTQLLNAAASIDSTGTVHISIGNTHVSTAQTVTITINNATGTFSGVTGEIVNGPSHNSLNDFGVAENVNIKPFANATLSGNKITTTLPAHSVVMLNVAPSQSSINEVKKKVISRSDLMVASLDRDVLSIDFRAEQSASASFILYTPDGRRLGPAYSTVLQPGNNRIQLNSTKQTSGIQMAIVSINAGGYSTTQRLLLAR